MQRRGDRRRKVAGIKHLSLLCDLNKLRNHLKFVSVNVFARRHHCPASSAVKSNGQKLISNVQVLQPIVFRPCLLTLYAAKYHAIGYRE